MVHAGSGLEALCGYEAADFGKGCMAWTDLVDDPDYFRAVAAAAPGVRSLTRRYLMTARDGAQRRILDQIDIERAPDGAVHAFTSVLIDVGDVKAAAGDIGRLAYVSHEVRTPLTGIIGLAETLAQSPLTPEQSDAVRALREAGAALMGLVNAMLDLSRLEAGAMRVDLASFRLGELCQSIAGLHARQAADAGLDLTVQGRAMDIALVGDAAKLRQIIGNLVTNALKFTPSGGVGIVWSCDPPDPDGGMLARVTVRDTGKGMDAETLARVFGAYEQAPDGALAGGAGLGLTIAQELARVLGGRLWAESAPGAGSSFHLEAPVRAAVEATTLASSAAVPGSGVPEGAELRRILSQRAIRVLVAEDTGANQHLLRLLLTPVNARLTFVHDGHEAVAAAGAQSFDAILMDSRMPRLGGAEATRRIRGAERARGGQRTPVIAMSAESDHDAMARFLAAGADDYVAKPFTAHRLLSALAAATADQAERPGVLRALGG